MARGERWFLAMGWRWQMRPTLAFRSSTPARPRTRPAAARVGTVPNPTSNNFIHITGGGITADPTNIHILVDGGGNTFNPLLSYSYQVAQVDGQNLSGISITNQSQFTTSNFDNANQFLISVTGNSGGAIFLNIAPVPEPTMVFGLAAGALRWRPRPSAHSPRLIC